MKSEECETLGNTRGACGREWPPPGLLQALRPRSARDPSDLPEASLSPQAAA